ncbi:MAG: serine/threonine-protein phosphatase [Acidobacteriota bacterium]|nr:serine/threonine-protein phosphatase [Acidobacteriota bacterium]
MSDESQGTFDRLADEIANFREIATHLRPSPGEVPDVEGIDIAAFSKPLYEVIGGDHLIYIDFPKRFSLERRLGRARARGRDEVVENLEHLKHRAGVMLADVSGHRMTDALIAAMLHQAFLVGVHYELDRYGEITTRIFEHLNTRFYRTTAVNKYFTMLYGEISEGGRFRFISAGHQLPLVFSREYGKIVEISGDRVVSFPPVGLLPPKDDLDDPPDSTFVGKNAYSVNEISLLAPGDLLLLVTDGFTEHDDGKFFPERVEKILAECSNYTAADICQRLEEGLLAEGTRDDDISAVVIQRTQ